MLHYFTSRRRFAFAVNVLRCQAEIEMSKTPVYADVKKQFFRWSKKRLYSNEASTAVVLLMFSLIYVQEAHRRAMEGEDTPMEFAVPFSRIPDIVRMIISTYEMKASDRVAYETEIGSALKAGFNEAWKRMGEHRSTQIAQARAG